MGQQMRSVQFDQALTLSLMMRLRNRQVPPFSEELPRPLEFTSRVAVSFGRSQLPDAPQHYTVSFLAALMISRLKHHLSTNTHTFPVTWRPPGQYVVHVTCKGDYTRLSSPGVTVRARLFGEDGLIPHGGTIFPTSWLHYAIVQVDHHYGTDFGLRES